MTSGVFPSLFAPEGTHGNDPRLRRRHAYEHYFDLVGTGRIDLSGLLTHRFRLDDWREAFTTIVHQGDTGAIKVAFDFRPRGNGGPGLVEAVTS